MKIRFTWFAMLFVFFPYLSSSQCVNSAYPTLCNNARGAYRTIGPDHTDFVNWDTKNLWERIQYQGNIKHFPIPPATSVDNNIYIEISAGHKVRLDESFSVGSHGNKLTLVVCGELEVGSIVEVPVITTSSIISSNCSPFTFSGSLLQNEINGVNPGFPDFIGYDADLVINEENEENGSYILGFEIALNSPDLTYYYQDKEPIFVYYEKNITDFNGIYSLNFSLNQLENIFGLTANSLDCSEFGSDYVLSVRAFAEFSVANGAYKRRGYGAYEYFPASPAPDLKKTTIKNDFWNNLVLIICETGTLIMDELNVHQLADIQVDGTFIVESINGGAGGSSTNCIYTSNPDSPGTIVTIGGGMPYITLPGFSYGGDNLNDDCLGGTPILPIDLLSFNSEIRPDRVEFSWTTGSEINNDYFTLERSRDLYGWEVLGFVEGAGNSSTPLSYSFSDLRPLDGLAYYRLKQTDFDGAFKYYGPIAAHYDLGLEGLDFKVMKNYSNWVIAVPNDGFYQVEVYNLQGHRLHSERVENTLSIPAPEGAVVIRVTDGFERSASRVVM